MDQIAQKSDLIMYSEAEKNAVLEYFNVSSKQFDEMAEQLMEWAMKSSLPEQYITMNTMKFGLLGCKMSTEKTKKAVTSYFRGRMVHSDIYQRVLPNTEEYKKCKLLFNTALMPKLTPDLCRITILTPNDPLGEATDGLTYGILTLMLSEVRIRSADYFVSNIIIIDSKHFNMSSFSKFTPSVIYTIMDIITSTKIRVKNIHVLNLPPIIDTMMAIVKPLLPNKIKERIQTHENLESIYQYIPKEYLPSDFGGTQPSLKEIQDKWCEEFEKLEADYRQLLSCKWHDTNGTSEQDHELFGTEGSFRKLSID